jgi:hypothetical protein
MPTRILPARRVSRSFGIRTGIESLLIRVEGDYRALVNARLS